jgi:hypothetical protein
VADQYHRIAEPSHRSQDAVDVAPQAVEAVLAAQHLVPFRLKRGNQLAETRSIGPKAVREHDARFGAAHLLGSFWFRRPAPGLPAP